MDTFVGGQVSICNQLLSDLLSKQKSASPKMMELTDFKYEIMVPRGRLELPTHGFSVHCSTN